ncbi:hypothetical protein HN864_04810, partial [archaeon]|nr:hypothetical protein [archaeon]
IEIFDTDFIAKNISDLDKITQQQQVNMNSIILGEEGRRIDNEIISLSSQITNNGTRKSGLTHQLMGLCSKNYNELVVINEIPEVDHEIDRLTGSITLLEKDDKIKTIIGGFNKFSVDNAEKGLLTKTIQVDLGIISSHKEKCCTGGISCDNFFNLGTQLSTKGFCAFCGSELSEEEELVENYKKYYSMEYENLISELSVLKNKVNIFNFEKWHEIWKFLSENGIVISEPDIRKLEELKSNIIQEINEKLSSVNGSRNIDAFIGEIAQIQEKFEEELGAISSDTTQLMRLKRERSLNLENKKIFSAQVQGIIQSYKSIEEETREFERRRSQHQQELTQYSQDIFAKYQDEINIILGEINSDFTLSIDSSYATAIRRGNQEVFSLDFSGNQVSINSEDLSNPCFGNTLSESDKKSLAFAFFVAQLRQDTELQEKIIVLDDPISSFDKERKNKTAEILLTLKNQEEASPNQIIILTHEQYFLMDIRSKAKTLGIQFHELTIKRNSISISDFSKEFESQVLKDLEWLSALKDNYNGEDFFVQARKILENIFKRKYFSKVKAILSVNNVAGVRTFVQEIYGTGTDEYIKGISLCNDLNIESHDNPSRQLTNGDKQTILNDFFNFLEIL